MRNKQLKPLLNILRNRNSKNILYLFLYLSLISNCTYRSNNILQISTINFDNLSHKLILDFTINIDNYSPLEKNLKMFSNAYVKINLTFKTKKNITIGKKTFERKINYNRWEQIFSIEDSNNKTIIKYTSFNDLANNIFNFTNIATEINTTNDTLNKITLYYDFILKSTDLAPPFNLLEYDLKFGNIKKTNQKLELVIENE